MNKQLITLIGALVTVGVVALGVLLGAVPLMTGGLTALEQTTQASSTNATYAQQIDSLNAAKKNLSQTEASVSALRAQIPEKPLLDQAFDIVDAAATASGATITSITRGELTAFEPRPAPPRSGLVIEKPAATPTPAADAPASDGTGPVSDAKTTASAADANAAATSADANGTAASPASGDTAAKPADAASGRQQVRVSIAVSAPTMDAVQQFLDGLRDAQRLVAIDKATVTAGSDGFDIKVEAITFLRTDGSAQ
ncbi:hypothetical protein [Microbacterium sp.]|jgi:hypothetical protein|uniref:hypothetical protein n=1 Tax=Microbacterium sp. TaxID=51671 RepID=UPI003A8CB81C